MKKEIQIKIGNKKAAIQLSISTIVVIVIAMSMLILGIILVRQVMCAGILLTDKVTQETENQITDLFGSSEFGIKCMGEEGDKVTLGSGGSRPIACISNFDTASTGSMTLSEATILKGKIGAHTKDANILGSDLILDKDWAGTLPSTKSTIVVATLDLPRDLDKSTIKLVFDEKDSSGTSVDTHPLIIDIEPVGTFTAAIC
jgi:hypothetical protein